MNTKHCSRCKQDLPHTAFGRNRSTKDGLSFYCKACAREIKREAYVPSPRPEFPDGHRDCTKCGEIKLFSEFHKATNGRFGLNSICKPCRSTAKPKPIAKQGFAFCTQCGAEKPFTAEYFRRNNSIKSGLATMCRECARTKAREWHRDLVENDPEYKKRRYWSNPEKHRAQGRASYRRNIKRRKAYAKRYRQENLDEIQAADREYYRKNAETIKERARRWRQDNPERYREYNQQWAEDNPEKHRKMLQANWVRRRARKQNLPHDLTTKEWEYCLEYWNHACAVCGDDEIIHADHWIPLSNDDCPGTIVDNMIPLCQHCNSTKHARDAELWLTEKFDADFAADMLDAIEAYFEHVVDYFESNS